MESLDSTDWDVLIAGTGFQESLLALALSKSKKKILHVDRNGYYGGTEAALSLQEAEEWAKSKTNTSLSNARISTEDNGPEGPKSKLGFSRAYSLALAPHIIYTRSSLLPLLVSSRSEQQLEFLAVGSWYVFTPSQAGTTSALARVPSSREDLFADASVDMRAKRALMKFLRFVGDFEEHPDWQDRNLRNMPLHTYLLDRFSLPLAAQAPFQALTLSPYPPRKTTTAFALPRIARHLRSLGLFGPGFGAVVPKWGGLAEIAQVGCRQSAVGGAVYVLGTGVENAQDETSDMASEEAQESASPASLHPMMLSNGDKVKTKWLAGTVSTLPAAVQSAGPSQETTITVSRSIAIISSPLRTLFPALADGAPQPAVAVVVFPSGFLPNMNEDTPPIHLFIHSSDTGECPVGQSVIYASIAAPKGSSLLDQAITSLLTTTEEIPTPHSLWKLHYEQQCSEKPELQIKDNSIAFSHPSVDLAFDDETLEQVQKAWAAIVDGEEGDGFMRFPAQESGMQDIEEGMGDL